MAYPTFPAPTAETLALWSTSKLQAIARYREEATVASATPGVLLRPTKGAALRILDAAVKYGFACPTMISEDIDAAGRVSRNFETVAV